MASIDLLQANSVVQLCEARLCIDLASMCLTQTFDVSGFAGTEMKRHNLCLYCAASCERAVIIIVIESSMSSETGLLSRSLSCSMKRQPRQRPEICIFNLTTSLFCIFVTAVEPGAVLG